MSAKICIVSPSYVSATPRVEKEAAALQDAGFDVCVVFAQPPSATWREHDSQVVARAGWRSRAVRFSTSEPDERVLWTKSALRQRFNRSLPRWL